MVSKIRDFILKDIWRIRTKKLPKKKSIVIQFFRVILLSFRGFQEDKCYFRASALTFYTLLSIVPLFAMLFGIAKGFGLDKILENKVLGNIQGQEEVMMKIMDFSRNLLDNTSGGLVAGIGVAFLFWTVIKLLGNIELSFNDIWGIKSQRTMSRKLGDYLSFMLICPILIVASSSITVFITTQVTLITQKIALLGIFSPLIFTSLKILPYCMIWILFTFIYVFMPNTKVNIKSGFLAGIIAGTIYQLVQWLYIYFQLGVAKYGAIYGSFAALPLFLIWLQVSWLIVLYGAEFSYAIQNEETYEFEPDCKQVSYSFKKLIYLGIAHLCIKRFAQGKNPLTANQISQELEVPIRLSNQVLYDLVQARILAEANGQNDKERAYQPAQDIDTLSVKKVLTALEGIGNSSIPIAKTKELNRITHCLSDLENEFQRSDSNILLKEI